MEALECLFDYDRYTKVPCKRWGLWVEKFSNVLGTLVIQGTIHYDSDKNFRSNRIFEEFKTTNAVSRRALIYILQEQDPRVVFDHFGATDEERDRQMGRLMSMYEGDYDCVVYARGAADFKFERSKIFYLKLKDVLYGTVGKESPRGPNFLVDFATLECRCTFAEKSTETRPMQEGTPSTPQ
jgi:hypothetical protein